MSPHLNSKLLDYAAALGGPGVIALASVTTLENWLKIVVLVLTVIFIALGIALRVMKIRRGGGGEEE